jgi:hypothetical protein
MHPFAGDAFQVVAQYVLVSHTALRKPTTFEVGTKRTATNMAFASRKQAMDHGPNQNLVSTRGFNHAIHLHLELRGVLRTIEPA